MRTLLYANCLDGSLHQNWLKGATPEFDVIINFKGMTEPDLAGVKESFREPTHKWPTILKRLRESSWLDDYDYFVLGDDDLMMTAADVNRLAGYAKENGLGLCQPSLTQASYLTWPWTLQRANKGHREVPFVELMCPVFSNAALRKCMPVMGRSESGWGLDIVWPILLGEPVHVMDEVAITHTRPVRSQGWQMDDGSTPQHHLAALLSSPEWDVKKHYAKWQDSGWWQNISWFAK